MARRPLRWNPMPVKIKVLAPRTATPGAVGNTVLDDDFDEVLGGVNIPFNNEYTLEAQVVYHKHDERSGVRGGDLDLGDGHLCFILEYLESVGLSPLVAGPKIKKGDRIIDMAGIATDYRIIEVRPAGHIHSVDNKPMLYLTYFEFPKDQQARIT